MSLNFDAIRRKLEKLSGNTNSRSTFWKPEEGNDYKVRLLSFPDNDGQPFKELMFYYNIPGQRGLLAPSQFGKPDPIQELITKLRDEGTKESYEMAKKLYPKMRVYAPVIVRGEEDKGVQIWGFGKLVYQSLLAIFMDEDYGDITDPKEGRDVTVRCTKAPGQQWAKTEVLPRGKTTALSNSKKEAKEWLDNIPDVTTMFTTKSYDELITIIDNWLNEDDNNDSSGTEWNTKTQSESSTSKSEVDIDDVFSDLI